VYACPGHYKPSYGTVCKKGVNVRCEFLRVLSIKMIALRAVMLLFGAWEPLFCRIMSCLP
jgi:hypothetical protein